MKHTNLHIMVSERSTSVWSSIYESGSVIFEDIDGDEINEWIALNSLVPLEFEETYFVMDDYEPANEELEYLLSEKETALFYLKFKR